MDTVNLLRYSSFYLVGIKGVAMTALAQCLVDAGKKVAGSDTDEEFVTQHILNDLALTIDLGFSQPIPNHVDCVIYTAAHQATENPQVKQAIDKNVPTFSHAQALASLFNQKKGIAVCGVGGKSTTSAMIAWILEKIGAEPSYAVGVGDIIGLGRTGKWSPNSEYFVAEADEYVTDPTAPKRGEPLTPRFSYLQPFITVCTNLRFDHPDVYRDFDHVLQTYKKFFLQIKAGGTLITEKNISDVASTQISSTVKEVSSTFVTAHSLFTDLDIAFQKRSITHWKFGSESDCDLELLGDSYAVHEIQDTQSTESENRQAQCSCLINKQQYTIRLRVPGAYNMFNALCALGVCHALKLPIEACLSALSSFRSTKRRFEFVGRKNGVMYYDDYAHHPLEIKAVIRALKEWHPGKRVTVGFQSHTFSRTKALFTEFVDAFSEADEVVMIDIFPSAREPYDPSVTSTMLCEEIEKKYPHIRAQNVGSIEQLVQFCRQTLAKNDVFMTVGAGDIYKVHELL